MNLSKLLTIVTATGHYRGQAYLHANFVLVNEDDNPALQYATNNVIPINSIIYNFEYEVLEYGTKAVKKL